MEWLKYKLQWNLFKATSPITFEGRWLLSAVQFTPKMDILSSQNTDLKRQVTAWRGWRLTQPSLYSLPNLLYNLSLSVAKLKGFLWSLLWVENLPVQPRSHIPSHWSMPGIEPRHQAAFSALIPSLAVHAIRNKISKTD